MISAGVDRAVVLPIAFFKEGVDFLDGDVLEEHRGHGCAAVCRFESGGGGVVPIKLICADAFVAAVLLVVGVHHVDVHRNAAVL